jgi:hypothetical protein
MQERGVARRDISLFLHSFQLCASSTREGVPNHRSLSTCVTEKRQRPPDQPIISPWKPKRKQIVQMLILPAKLKHQHLYNPGQTIPFPLAHPGIRRRGCGIANRMNCASFTRGKGGGESDESAIGFPAICWHLIWGRVRGGSVISAALAVMLATCVIGTVSRYCSVGRRATTPHAGWTWKTPCVMVLRCCSPLQWPCTLHLRDA